MTEAETTIAKHLLYNADHKVLICRPCRHAIGPGPGIKRHFKEKHQSIALKVWQQLVDYGKDLCLTEPRDVASLDPTSEPIEGLELSDGKVCNECNRICISEDSMLLHMRTTHQWVKEKGLQWEARKVQTWFHGPNHKYFVVTPQITEGSASASPLRLIDGWIDQLLAEASAKDKAENELLGVVDANQHMVDKSPWMRRTGWLREFAGKDMATIIKKSWRPMKDEAGLQLIWKSIDRVLDTCVDGVKNCTDRNWMLIPF